MSIDWSTAPKDATHWEPDSYHVFGSWMKKEGDSWFWWEGDVGRWSPSLSISEQRMGTFEARPQESWNGQGLPPVGTLCEWHGPNSDGPDGWVYTESNVVAYTDDGLFICMQKPGCWPVVQRIDNCEFRPLRTPEQIAAEERSKECDRIFVILSSVEREGNRSDMAEALYDAGYRRQEEGK
ncbi:TPA: hypothetical protein VDT58_001991 [Pseudomonas aeruginosa]|nr:hypothetical protein [Pseudomonas aeruginosa]